MYDPMIPEAIQMYETMTSKHTRVLASSSLEWETIKDPDGYPVQVLPRVVLVFKG